MSPEIKALLDRKPPKGYGLIKEVFEKRQAWEAELRQLRRRLSIKAAERKTDNTAKDLSDEHDDLGRWFLCSACLYGMDDYYSDDESQMADNELNFCPCCGAKIVRGEGNR